MPRQLNNFGCPRAHLSLLSSQKGYAVQLRCYLSASAATERPLEPSVRANRASAEAVHSEDSLRCSGRFADCVRVFASSRLGKRPAPAWENCTCSHGTQKELVPVLALHRLCAAGSTEGVTSMIEQGHVDINQVCLHTHTRINPIWSVLRECDLEMKIRSGRRRRAQCNSFCCRSR